MRIIDRLSEMQVKNAKPAKGKFVTRLLDGNGLYLQATRSKTGGINRNWVFRYELDGQRHDMGIGSLHDVGLAAARMKAKQLREQIVLHDIDPLEARNEAKAERRATSQAKRAEKAKAVTFAECAAMYLKVHSNRWKNPKHRAQWESTLDTYAYPIIGNLDVGDIDEGHLIRVLQPIWTKIPETASRLRARMENILGYAIASRFRRGDNPARWRGHLKTLLGGAKKDVEHHPALPFIEAPAFIANLRQRDSLSARALEFTILTAARTGETIGAKWSEINTKDKVWTVAGSRMKTGIEHRVPLCDRAIAILKALPRRGDFVFGSAVTGKPLSNMALLELLRGMRPGLTVHGFRSSFRDWAAEQTSFPNHIVEKALSHAVGDKVEAAYRRGDLFAKRARLMDQWQRFLDKPLPIEGSVADISRERQRLRG